MSKHKPILTILIIFLLVKLLYFTQYMVVLWDEAVYIGIGKHLYSLGNIGLFESIRPLFLPLMTGAIWKSGLDVIIYSKLLALIFSILYIYLTYLLAEEIFNKKIAILASILVAITPIFFFQSIFVMAGIPSTFFGLLAIYFFVKKKSLFLVGAIAALSFLTRFPQGLIFTSLLLLILLNSKNKIKDCLKLTSSFIIITLPYLIFNYMTQKNIFAPLLSASEHQSNIAHSVITQNPWSYLYNIFFYLIEAFQQNIFLILIILGVIYIIKKKHHFNIKIQSLFIPSILLLIYLTAIINKQPRFLLVLLPFFCIIASYAFVKSLKYIISFSKTKKRVFGSLLIILILATILTTTYKNYDTYGWRIDEETLFQKDFLKYFSDKDANCILTTDPVPVVYTDKKFIPYYNLIDQSLQTYIEHKNNCDYVIYSPDPFKCQFFGEECYTKREQLFNVISLERQQVFHNTYYGQNYYIFK